MSDPWKPLAEYATCYYKSADLPQSKRLENFEGVRRARFDAGAAAFFEPLAKGLPQLYEVLVKHCAPLCIGYVEMPLEPDTSQPHEWVKREDKYEFVGQWKRREGYYELATANGERLICCGRPTYDPETNRGILRIIEEKARFLPSDFVQFFRVTDEMSIRPFGFTAQDAPQNGWDELNDACQHWKTDISKGPSLYDVNPDGDWRVLIKCINGDMIAVDRTSDSKDLYLVPHEQYGNYQKLQNPSATLDEYMARRILGHRVAIRSEGVVEVDSYPWYDAWLAQNPQFRSES